MKTLLLCTLALILTAGSCKKNTENQLPPATQTGANTFGCYVNGILHSVKGIALNPNGPITTSGIICTISPPYNYVNIKTIDYNKNGFYISFNFKNNKLIEGTYTEGLSFSYSNILDPSKLSKVVITRYDSKVLAGTFEMYFLNKTNPENGQKYAITEGRFDINLDN